MRAGAQRPGAGSRQSRHCPPSSRIRSRCTGSTTSIRRRRLIPEGAMAEFYPRRAGRCRTGSTRAGWPTGSSNTCLTIMIGDADRAFIEAADMFFLATVDEGGQPSCSVQGRRARASFASSIRARSRFPTTTATACSCRWATSREPERSACCSSTSSASGACACRAKREHLRERSAAGRLSRSAVHRARVR